MRRWLADGKGRAASHRLRLLAGLTVGLQLLGAVDAVAQGEIPALTEMDGETAAANPQLVQEGDALTEDRKALRDRANEHNAACSAVEEGSAADASCSTAYAGLAAAIDYVLKLCSKP